MDQGLKGKISDRHESGDDGQKWDGLAVSWSSTRANAMRKIGLHSGLTVLEEGQVASKLVSNECGVKSCRARKCRVCRSSYRQVVCSRANDEGDSPSVDGRKELRERQRRTRP